MMAQEGNFMRRFPFTSLRSRLMLLVVLALLPELLLTLYTDSEERQRTTQQAEDSASELMRVQTREERRTIDDAQLILSPLASLTVIKVLAMNGCDQTLSDLL